MLTSRVGRAATIGMLLALGVVPAWAHAAGRLAPIDDRLAAVLASPVPAAGVRVRVSLRSDDLPAGIAPRLPLVSARQQRVLDAAIPAGFQLGYRYTYLSGFSGFAAQGAIEALRRHPEVQAIHFDWEVHATLSHGLPLIPL